MLYRAYVFRGPTIGALSLRSRTFKGKGERERRGKEGRRGEDLHPEAKTKVDE